MKRVTFLAGCWLTLASLCACDGDDSDNGLKLWYNRPAADWNEALPIGNGRIGAMVFGGPATDRIQFNEETLWNGQPRDYNRPGAAEVVGRIRQLLISGKQAEAEALAGERFMGLQSEAGDRQAWFQRVRWYEGRWGKLHAPDFDDSQWPVMELPTHSGWEASGIHGFQALDGALWLRTRFDCPDSLTGKALILDLGKIRDQDFTYLNGVLIGTMEGSNEGRRYRIPKGVLKAGTNHLAVQVLNYYDNGGFVGYKDTSVPLAIYPDGGSHASGFALPTQWKYFVQDDNAPAVSRYQADYQPFADLTLHFEGHDSVSDYRRELDISKAVASTSYISNGVRYRREYLVSHPANLMLVHLQADKAGALTFDAALSSPHPQSVLSRVDEQTLGLSLQVKNGALRGTGVLRVKPNGGTVSVSDDRISVRNADEVTLYLTAATNFKHYDDVSGDPDSACRAALAAINNNSYAAIRDAHINDYRSYFDTFSIDFGTDTLAHVPTDQRIERFAEGRDPHLLAIYAQYGRYLLISSSRPGTQPANLQGIWNELITPPWGSKYTTNINVEMNYWPAELTGLSPLHEPLFDMVDDLRERGRETARIHYGTPGWVVHHNTDLWRGTAPINHPNHGIWLGGPAWFCHHLWERYLFAGDETFLRDRAYPAMKEAALFYQHNLQEDTKTGYLISSPSNSPENGGLVAGPAMDHQLIRSLFRNVITAASVLKRDGAWAGELQAILSRIARDQVGQHGQLQEWLEDIDDPENKHRHVSHLWAVYPGNEINWDTTPDLMEAARVSLNHRGDGGTGWSLAWKINLWTRMRDAERTEKLLKMLISPAEDGGGSYPNLLDAHPPFQIDGNFGGTAGIVESLLQSHTGYIDILPALLPLTANGEVHGIRARGGYVISLRWRNHQLETLKLYAERTGKTKLRYRNKVTEVNAEKGGEYVFNGKLEMN